MPLLLPRPVYRLLESASIALHDDRAPPLAGPSDAPPALRQLRAQGAPPPFTTVLGPARAASGVRRHEARPAPPRKRRPWEARYCPCPLLCPAHATSEASLHSLEIASFRRRQPCPHGVRAGHSPLPSLPHAPPRARPARPSAGRLEDAAVLTWSFPQKALESLSSELHPFKRRDFVTLGPVSLSSTHGALVRAACQARLLTPAGVWELPARWKQWPPSLPAPHPPPPGIVSMERKTGSNASSQPGE